MEQEEAPSRRSVAELAGRFKGSTPAQSAAGNEVEKPVRRRPPRSLQIPKPTGDEQEPPPGVTSPLPAKAKRNSALIEKLQANLALSPSGPPPKSPGFRLLPPTFTPPSPGSAPAATVTTSSSVTPTSPVATSPLTEEGPASFEAPPTAAEGSVLQSINKGRARHSVRRRPPSRRHRKSSSGDEVGVTDDVADGHPSEAGGGDDLKKENQTDASTPPEENKSHEEDESKSGDDVKEGGSGSVGGEEGGGPSSEQKEEEEEKTSAEKQKQEEGSTETDGTEEEKSEETESPSSAR